MVGVGVGVAGLADQVVVVVQVPVLAIVPPVIDSLIELIVCPFAN
jgi:hypothetical protein